MSKEPETPQKPKKEKNSKEQELVRELTHAQEQNHTLTEKIKELEQENAELKFRIKSDILEKIHAIDAEFEDKETDTIADLERFHAILTRTHAQERKHAEIKEKDKEEEEEEEEEEKENSTKIKKEKVVDVDEKSKTIDPQSRARSIIDNMY